MLRQDVTLAVAVCTLAIEENLLRVLAVRPELDDELLAALVDLAPAPQEVADWDRDGWPDRDSLLSLGALKRPS